MPKKLVECLVYSYVSYNVTEPVYKLNNPPRLPRAKKSSMGALVGSEAFGGRLADLGVNGYLYNKLKLYSWK